MVAFDRCWLLMFCLGYYRSWMFSIGRTVCKIKEEQIKPTFVSRICCLKTNEMDYVH